MSIQANSGRPPRIKTHPVYDDGREIGESKTISFKWIIPLTMGMVIGYYICYMISQIG